MRPTFAEISLTNLKYNFLNLQKRVRNSKVMAVVKADAYGHGMLKCVESLNELGVQKPEYYGVALLEEAIELRKSNLADQKILTFSPFNPEEIKYYLKYDIMPTVCTSDHIKYLSKYHGKKILLHINVETGMGRLGLEKEIAVDLIKELAGNNNLAIDGIYTHFATSDEKDKFYANLQLKRFNEIISKLKYDGINFDQIHAANSGAILDLPSSHLSMVRPGISLYGYYPSLETSESIKLKPVMSLVTHISTIKEIKRGDSVSYGRKFIANRKTKIATAPIGYADGVPRLLTNKMRGIHKNGVINQIGTVTMDRIMFNISNVDAKVGDRIILLGEYKNNSINAWDWGKVLKTIPYEVTCNISKRVPRVYY